MARIKSPFEEVKTPFSNMSFTPDVPSAALAPQEYNSGYNVETDTRGIKSVLGDEQIMNQLTGYPTFVTSGYRNETEYWIIVCCISTLSGPAQGRWYGITPAGVVTNVTPGVGADPTAFLPGYTASSTITDAWNGTVLFINDGVNVPMYIIPEATEFYQYDAAPDNYVWNYNNDWSSLSAGFMRVFSTPNVGSILIAGNLTADVISSGLTVNFPATVRWSQAFGLNSGPTTWAPTINNVANELEVPVRGPVIDGFPCNGNFFVCSYWDTVVFSPIAYQSSNAPVLGVRLMNQGRGLLNENCWANADEAVFGVDARDIWVFNGQTFKSLGNQRVKDWFYSNLNPSYPERTFVINNTSKNQIEIYFADLDSADGWPNQMLSYRYDLDVFNPPRAVSSASHATETPVWGLQPDSSLGYNPATRGVVYSQGVLDSYLVQKDQGYSFLNNTPISSLFRRDNITLGLPYSQQSIVHRIYPEVTGVGNVTVQIGGAPSVGATPTFQTSVNMPIDTATPWTQINQNSYRVNTVQVSSSSTTNYWDLTALNWQFTAVEDAR